MAATATLTQEAPQESPVNMNPELAKRLLSALDEAGKRNKEFFAGLSASVRHIQKLQESTLDVAMTDEQMKLLLNVADTEEAFRKHKSNFYVDLRNANAVSLVQDGGIQYTVRVPRNIVELAEQASAKTASQTLSAL